RLPADVRSQWLPALRMDTQLAAAFTPAPYYAVERGPCRGNGTHHESVARPTRYQAQWSLHSFTRRAGFSWQRPNTHSHRKPRRRGQIDPPWIPQMVGNPTDESPRKLIGASGRLL